VASQLKALLPMICTKRVCDREGGLGGWLCTDCNQNTAHRLNSFIKNGESFKCILFSARLSALISQGTA